ncbi:HEXXH motif-containing putative peptide modification protein [Actinomycetospora sp. OC33-EN08]|uniref:HEXXH motif-containing putative peptide modification protein n=1 Tax=Actinomycetospora aurantiaca TaxID=3129233 RepID=A0ABU8MGD9_9PSEU
MIASETERRRLMRDPAFHAWLGLVLDELARQHNGATSDGLGADDTELEDLLRDFAFMRTRIGEREAQASRLESSTVVVQGEDLDRLIQAVTPPSYTFRSGSRAATSHPIGFLADVASVALHRIGQAWPECRSMVEELVSIIGYLPDAGFRSCSVLRYSGVIYIGAGDNSILDLEESIVHEAGHQLLYMISERDQLVEPGPDAERQYSLPWSGQLRNVYGYLHAFYIYVLLAKYFARVVHATSSTHLSRDHIRAERRLETILIGLAAASTTSSWYDKGRGERQEDSKSGFDSGKKHAPSACGLAPCSVGALRDEIVEE